MTSSGSTCSFSYMPTTTAVGSKPCVASRPTNSSATPGRKSQDGLVLSTDTYVAVANLLASRTISLPKASTFPRGKPLYVADESGACSPTVTITIAASGSDTIAGQVSVTMGSPYQKLTFHSNGSNLWTFA
jgi:hypothetical protein